MARVDNGSLTVFDAENHTKERASLASLCRFGKAETIGQGSPSDHIVMLIRERLERHPHFRGRVAQLQIEAVGDAIVLSGHVPTYYLKQLLQEAVKNIPNVATINNRVDVTFQ